jgi:uncharacterized protein YecE (DUF72 family)
VPSGITPGVTATASTLTGLYVGTSGFSYPTWRPDFYPAGSKPKDFLRLYAERLPSLELNATFYQLPSEERLEGWAAQTPPAFRFAVKMNRRITHFGALDLVPTFCERVRVLGDRLGPILIQFPPSRQRDDGMLRLLVDSLDPELRYAFEFRHDSWAGIEPVLNEAGAVRVGSLDGEPRFRYLRLREPPYDAAALLGWADRLRPLLRDGVEVYAYFKHEDEPLAPRYALELLELLAQ